MAEETGFEPARPFGLHDFQSCALVLTRRLLRTKIYNSLAEGVGFEPTVRLPSQQFSRLPQ